MPEVTPLPVPFTLDPPSQLGPLDLDLDFDSTQTVQAPLAAGHVRVACNLHRN